MIDRLGSAFPLPAVLGLSPEEGLKHIIDSVHVLYKFYYSFARRKEAVF